MKRFPRKGPAAVLVFSVLLPLAAAGSLKKNLKIIVQEKRIQGLSTDGLTLSFILEVANASPDACRLTGYDYRVLVRNSEYFRLDRTLDPALDIAPSGSTRIALPVRLTYAYLLASNPGLFDLDKLECTLVGGLVFTEEGRRGERLNVAMTGEFPVFKGFRTTVGPLEVRSLSVGGADLTFKAEFQNLNGFGLEVESIRYKLEIGGMTVAQGRGGGGRLEAAASTALVLPLLLEFFELGPELYPLLREARAECRLSGELAIVSAWGSHLVPFDQTLRADVRRVGGER